jgi:hypothetical protein
LAGADRYETAVALSTEVTHDYEIGRVVLVDGTRADSWAPGFTASILGTRFSTALILSNGESLPEVSRNFLQAYGQPQGNDIELVCTAYTAPAACDEAEAIMGGGSA